MKKIFLFCLLLPGAFISRAHPGIGIVKDSKGNIYYTDLAQVWKIDAATGTRTVVVRNVHTHELSMDTRDNLYGEHLWYNGEAANTWGHYVWRLQRNGVLDTVIRPSEGFLENYSFVRDSSGNMYWAQRFRPVSRIQKSTPDGKVTTLAEGKFRDIRWMHVTPGGTVYFIDLTDLYRVESGRLTLMARNLQERTSLTEYTDLQHNTYGIWLDAAENIYVAVLGGQVVKKITPAGLVKDVVYSPGLWRPSAGVFDEKGNMWLMETNISNDVRVRKISKETLAKTPPALTNMINKARPVALLVSVLLVIAVLVYLVVKRVKKRKAQGIPGLGLASFAKK